jgi:hypothetical protein
MIPQYHADETELFHPVSIHDDVTMRYDRIQPEVRQEKMVPFWMVPVLLTLVMMVGCMIGVLAVYAIVFMPKGGW